MELAFEGNKAKHLLVILPVGVPSAPASGTALRIPDSDSDECLTYREFSGGFEELS
jgi:hypothetical protein